MIATLERAGSKESRRGAGEGGGIVDVGGALLKRAHVFHIIT